MNIAVILAGGVGNRLGMNKPKQFLKVAGKTVLEHTVDVFQKHNKIDEIVIVMNSSYIHDTENMVMKNKWTKVKKVLSGGKERYESSLVAINAYNYDTRNINLIFHDAVRPLVSERIIDEVILALNTYNAVDVSVPAVDTIIALDNSKNFIDKIPDRSFLNRGQTPQGFKYETIKRAYEIALRDSNFAATDDCGVVKKYLPETPVYLVEGEERNVKLTYPEDIYLLDKLFQLKSATLSEKIDLQDLEGKVLVVFGGNSGIGKDIIKIAKSYGAHAYAFSRSTTNTDITDFESIKKALKDVYEAEGVIDYVVNTAAILNKEPFMHLDFGIIKNIIDTNYLGMINVTRAAFEYLKISEGQVLQFTSSSYTKGRAYYSLYSSTKAAVVNFVQAIAEEWESARIRVNCINPQRTKTPMRVNNFGIEPEDTLLKSKDVALVSLKTLLSRFTGEVVDIRIVQN